ncbi:thioredoxin [Sphaerosporella brunnea]|uniref:Thioredoxin n=1 Tax=Sphaerosporella brunnea TaxID=1250544 RepID=A0A5J5EKP8_9PEZI|nr:thioredoxin [Sphaerosporella brunnea]
MRFGNPLSLLLAALAGQGLLQGVLAAPDGAAAAPAAGDEAATAADVLPEVLELTANNFRGRTASGFWFVKHYSPGCPHCQAVAPIWKEVAFHYMTLPVTPENAASPITFQEAYNFNFGSLNCVAYGDLCIDELKIEKYPTFTVYKNGHPVEVFDQTIDKDGLSKFVEKYVEIIKTEQKALAELKAKTPPERPNPKGESVPLDTERFTKLITTSRDAWFVKFYAPWCGHCQAMAPAWAELGKEMQGELNVGEVNCDVEKRLCRDLKLRGYPTILFFQNGERVEYDGLRGLGDLVNYARKAVDSGVKQIDDAKFKELDKAGDMEVAFVYFYDHAAVSEDFEALDRLTLNLIGHAPLFKTNDDAMAARFRITSRPKFMVVRDGRPSYYNALAPHDLRDYNRVLGWMKSVWLPIVPELSAANSHEIMNNKVVVLGVLSRDKPDEFTAAKKELKEAAVEFMQQRQEEEQAERKRLRDQKQLRLEEAEDRDDQRAIGAAKGTRINVTPKKEVGFAWVDGVFWERWVRSTYGVNVNTDGARIIINDEDVSFPPVSAIIANSLRTNNTGTKTSTAAPSTPPAAGSWRRLEMS